MRIALHIIFISLLFVIGCKKKEEDGPTLDLSTVKVRTITHTSSGSTDTYSYAGDGKIVSIAKSTGSSINYTYNNDTISVIRKDAANTIVGIDFLIVDSFGLVKNAIRLDGTGNVVGYDEYSFNSNKEKTMLITRNANMVQNGKYEWIWSNGNMIQSIVYDSAGIQKVYDTYYWFYDPAGTSIGNINTGQSFWGADSKYLVRRYIQYSDQNGNSYRSFEYESDKEKRITSMSVYNQNGSLQNKDTYTYY